MTMKFPAAGLFTTEKKQRSIIPNLLLSKKLKMLKYGKTVDEIRRENMYVVFMYVTTVGPALYGIYMCLTN